MRNWLTLAMVGVTGAMLIGCSSARDVEVTGEVTAPASVQGKILLDFLDLASDSEKPESVHTQTLAAPGAFTATAPLEGDKVRILAVNDTDGNGSCSAGEAWAQVDADVTDDKVTGVKLDLKVTTCPVPAAD
jgi:hypothetical protein